MKLVKEIKFSGRKLILESGVLAKQASGSCVITYGGTVAFVAVTSSKGEEEDRGFFPLTVDYREKAYAAGRIPGNKFKREGRMSEKETLSARLTDHQIRPMFPKGLHREVQVYISILSSDGENEADVLGMLGASAALCISDIPLSGPMGAVRVGRIEGELVFNPTKLAGNEVILRIASSRLKICNSRT